MNRISKKIKDLGDFQICPHIKDNNYRVEKKELSDIAPINGVDVAIFIVGNVTEESLFQKCSELNMIYRDYVIIDHYSSDISYVEIYQRKG